MKLLPPEHVNVESTEIMKKLITAHRNLAELKGVSKTIPNQSVLINTLSLQEARDSSEIENIITTRDQMFIARDNIHEQSIKPAAKEVVNYATALKTGFDFYKDKGIITSNMILNIQQIVVGNDAGFRKQPGTVLQNDRTGEIVYTPPEPLEIDNLVSNLIEIINDDSKWDADPLVKMATIHFQFESIHPFYDGNGRTGRIINILYLVKEGLLDLPILYLSRFINQNKGKYYEVLQKVRTDCEWEQYISFMLEGIARTAKTTTELVNEIVSSMGKYKHFIRDNFKNMYSQDLINTLFYYPYTKIEHMQKNLNVTYVTARKYLEQLSSAGLLEKVRLGKFNYYVNKSLMSCLTKIEADSLKI